MLHDYTVTHCQQNHGWCRTETVDAFNGLVTITHKNLVAAIDGEFPMTVAIEAVNGDEPAFVVRPQSGEEPGESLSLDQHDARALAEALITGLSVTATPTATAAS